MIGLYLGDSALALARDGVRLSVAPSIVHADAAVSAVFGSPAPELVRLRPLAVSTRHWVGLARGDSMARQGAHATVRAELSHRLAIVDSPGDIRVAVPASFTAETCGDVLGVLQECGWIVHGFHDAAALTVAACGIDRPAIVVEVGLHHIAGSTVSSGARRRATSVRADSGMLALQDAWLDLVSEAMVRRSRFDPLHDAAQEQRVYDAVMGWATTAAREGIVHIEWSTPTGSIALPLTRDAFAAAAAPIYRDVLGVVHELRSAGSAVDLLLPQCMRDWPGMAEALEDIRTARRFVIPADVAARAVSLLPTESSEQSAQTSVMLWRGASGVSPIESPQPWPSDSSSSLPVHMSISRRPSHAIFGERAYPLTPGTSLGIGRMPGPTGLALPEQARGVSRLHCTLRVVDEGVELIDHSRHGTWINDERVVRRVRVSAGDRIRVGEPALVIGLLAAGEPHGPPS